MDRWKDSELEKMKVGGNSRAKEFFESQSEVTSGTSFSDKYNSRTAALYRDKVRGRLLSVGRMLSVDRLGCCQW